MTPSEIIARAKRVFNTPDSVYSDADALSDLNVIKNDFQAAIISTVNEDYNWDEWTGDLVAGQSEYSVPAAARDATGALKIEGLSLNFDGKVYDTTAIPIYYEARLVNSDSIVNGSGQDQKDWNWYLAYQDPAKPLFMVKENSVFIAPLPKASQAGGIKFRGIKNIPDYTLSSTEADMKIPYTWHEILVLGLGEYCYSQKAMPAEAQNCRAVYEKRRDEACQRLGDRVTSPFVNEYPSNSQYQPDAYVGDFPNY